MEYFSIVVLLILAIKDLKTSSKPALITMLYGKHIKPIVEE